MKRRPKVEPYAVPRWMAPALQVLRPKKRLPVSAWAEANRILPDTNAVAGPWRNALTPYLIEIMDAFSDDTTEQIVFVKPTQVGGTSAMENALGSAIDQDPGPAMVVYPSDQLAKRTVESKLEPMFKSCPALAAKYRAHESEDLAQRFDGMTVYLTGANSPADLSSTPIRYLFLDEVDKYPGSTKKESDPVSLAVERTKSYRLNRKIFMASTPTLKTGLIWRAKEAAEVEKHYFVPCPHCGAFIELKFAQLKWPGKEEEPDPIQRARRARYVCQECGCILTDRDKPAMLRAGRWQFVRKDSQPPRSVAFWMNTLYSPFTTFEEVVREFLKVKDDPERLHNFVNSWLAEPWEETKLKTSADLVLERQTETPAWQLPPWTRLLTGGIDVQENCMYWTIRAWGDFMTSQCVAHGQALSGEEVERVMNAAFQLPSGERMRVALALMDSSDQTDTVYEFCLMNLDWVAACKGSSKPLPGYYKISVVDKPDSRANGMQLIIIDTGKYKDMICEGQIRFFGLEGEWIKGPRPAVNRFRLKEAMTPRELARQFRGKGNAQNIRLCGAVDQPCTNLSLCFGTPGGVFDELRNPDIDLVLTGEACEWQLGEYARDAAQLGFRKSLMILGHIPSEREGMRLLAEWMKERFSQFETRYFECGEVYCAP